MNEGRVVVVGSYNHDFTWYCLRFPAIGETLAAEVFTAGHGGKGSNQAVACARQGASTCLIAAIGSDATGDAAVVMARDEQIDARWQVLQDVATGSACVLVDSLGQNQIVVHAGANSRLDAAHVRTQSDAFELARVTLMQFETAMPPLRTALELAKSNGALCIINPAPAREDADPKLVGACDLLIPNETECLMMLRQAGCIAPPKRLADIQDADLANLTAKLAAPSVAVTLGEHGVFVAHRDGPRLHDMSRYYRLSAPTVRVIDTTGAGDVFCGSLAATIAMRPEDSLSEVARLALHCAPHSTERPGAGFSAPTRRQVFQRFPGLMQGSGST